MSADKSRDLDYIERISIYCGQVAQSLSEINDSYTVFMERATYQNAVAMSILQIGELVKNLSPEFIADHKEIPWHLIAKTRDTYAHHYGNVDFELVWDTAVNDLPPLRAFCLKQLGAN